MSQMGVDLKEKVREFPLQSGVYLMKNTTGKILYVGKAKNLKSRVLSYFSLGKDVSPKVRLLMQNISEIEYILTKTEIEAFLLEATLIKKHRPKYNIRLRDDKSYPYIKMTWQEEFPRLYLSRKVHRDGALYFGPYTSGNSVAVTIRFLNRTFRIRDCTDAVMKSRTRPCMSYQIGRCSAPCVAYVNSNEYRAECDGARQFLKGQNKKIIKSLTEKMEDFSREEKFEQAARMRDSIVAVRNILQRQSVINESSDTDQDVVGYFGDSRGSLVEMIHVRGGHIIGNHSHFLPQFNEHDVDPREWIVDFLNQYYVDNFIPDEVLTPVDLGRDLNVLLEAVLKERGATDKVLVRFPTDEKGREILEMANENAQAHFHKHVTKSEQKEEGLREIQIKFGLSKLPKRIECYDISHFQGSETVASLVVFEDGVPNRDQYRRFRLSTVQGGDDYKSMQEVLKRRFAHAEWEIPNLILIDGGKGQLKMAQAAIRESGYGEIPMVSLAKSRTQRDFESSEVVASAERFFLPGRQNALTFRTSSQAYRILVAIRDEAHRFAITYHRKLREGTSLESVLDQVVGLGEKRKAALLSRFQSVEEVRNASPEEISKMKGFSLTLAKEIVAQLNQEKGTQEKD